MKSKTIKKKILSISKKILDFIFWKKSEIIFWRSPSVNTLLYKEPHSCGMIALQEIFPKLSTKTLKETFLFCCEKWPHDGVKKRDMNVSLRHLKLYDLMIYKDVSEDNLSLDELIKKTNKTYMVLVPHHYFVLKNGTVIDNNGEYYYKQKDKIFVHCYWELIK